MENRQASVSGAATASFVYDGDGKQIKATVNGITAVYVGNHYEVKNGIVTKYYFAGSTRIAVRKDGTLNFLLSDHLGSSSVTTNANGAKTASALYKAFGETRYTLGSLNTDYKFTGQREEASLGIYFFQARWFDPSLGRFLSPDTIVPTSTQGTQAWDRYAFVNNNPVRYNDPTGHRMDDGCNTDGCDVGTLETYTLAGIETVSPSYFGFKINYRPPLLVAAWTALGAHTSAGRAKLYPEEVEELGIDPQTPEGAFLGMQERISDRIKACTGCSETDKLIVAALGSDKNFSVKDVQLATANKYALDSGSTTIDWKYYLQDTSGGSYSKYASLIRTFASNVQELQSQGHYVPGGVNFNYIQSILYPSMFATPAP